MAKMYSDNLGLHKNTVHPKKRKPSWSGTKDKKSKSGIAVFLRVPDKATLAALDKAVAAEGYASRQAWFLACVEESTGLELLDGDDA